MRHGKMKKWISMMLVGGMFLSSVYAAEPSVSATAACLMDAQSGQVLYEKNADQMLPMASTTKIMTAILALESGRLRENVTISQSAMLVEGSKIYAKAGEQYSLYDLVQGLMLASGNDAAVAIAEFLDGSVENFAAQMTAKAYQIGAQQTSFQNAHGLSAENHYTTARDLARITCYALKNPQFAQIVKKKSAVLSPVTGEGEIYVKNHNKLLTLYDGAIGVKTGYTKEAGRCLVGAAQKDGLSVVTVTLKDPDDWRDHMALFDYAFSHYELQPIFEKHHLLKTIAVKGGTSDYLHLVSQKEAHTITKMGEKRTISLSYQLPRDVKAPVKRGDKIGFVKVYVDHRYETKINLVAKEDIAAIEKPAFTHYFVLVLKKLLRPM